ncbi:MAG: excinuclease ABC subunit UvrC [Candidatus Woesearchaeota archaeon]
MINLEEIPKSPGCYIYKDSKENIIYIGKAKNLKKRVSSYFQKKDNDPKTQALVKAIDSVDFIATNSEVEALILENNLIKKNKPKYNIDLKDSKRYAYILLTDEKFPRLVIARDVIQKGTYFGPFVSARERDYVIEFLTRNFKIRTCKKLPKKACLRYHMKWCEAPCIGNVTEDHYMEGIEYAKKILSGNTKDAIDILKSDMKKHSEEQNFEVALDMRNKIEALISLNEKQNMERRKVFDEDVINYHIEKDKVYLMVFNVYKGTLANKEEFIFNHIDGFFEDFIKQYYSSNNIPKEIILPEDIDLSIAEYLTEKRGSQVRINIPKIGEKKKLLDLVERNIKLTFFRGIEKVQKLGEKLKLPTHPHVIECFDISHLSGTSTVASMVQFREGRPDKSNYRRFRIRTVENIDDFKSMSEVVQRRYKRLKQENLDMPDLIIIDGGKGQLSSAINEIKSLGLNIPTISIAKREEEIFFPGSRFPLKLSKKDTALKYIQEIRDEAHRFAITYNRLLRKKSLTETKDD